MVEAYDYDAERASEDTWIFVRDFVGKFWFLALCVQAAYRSTAEQKRKAALGPTEKAVHNILMATTNLKASQENKTLSNLLEPSAPLPKAARQRFPKLISMTGEAVDADAGAFLELVLGPRDGGENDPAPSLVGLRHGTANAPMKPSDWFAALKSVIAYVTVTKLLNLNSGSALTPEGKFETVASGHQISECSNAPFYRLFGGSTLRIDNKLVPALERVPLSRAMQGYEPQVLLSNVSWSGRDDDPLLTGVPTNALLRTALSFGFGCSAGEHTPIDSFGSSVRASGNDLRIAAWQAFAGTRHEKGSILWRGESLEDFAEAYFKILQATATENTRPAVVYVKGSSWATAKPMVTTPRAKQAKSTAKRNDVPSPLKDRRKIIEDAIGQSTSGTIAYTDLAQNLLQFQFAARYLDDQYDEFVFPVCELSLDATSALGNVTWDGDTIASTKVTSRTGGTVAARMIEQTSTLVRYSFRREESDEVGEWGKAFHDYDMFALMRVMEAKRDAKINLRLRARVGEGHLKRADGKDSGDALDALQQALRYFIANAQTEANDARYVTLKEWEVTFNIDVPETYLHEEDR